ncbi:FGGY-family carbohydrate kinase [Sporolactobacillus sp. KGMB 08714]|uniref:FGGY-family carbohydrate kinase n=1 Tax=Sporolactobacillus sp. KGMB 08714 TaxID=3064704 RepID=UPI002FBEF78F
MTELTLAIDQSTQGTKVLLIDHEGTIKYKTTRTHRQLISPEGWISHDLTEIQANLKALVHLALAHAKGATVTSVAISNQRETAAAWSRSSGEPLALAIVWQDNRAKELVDELVAKPESGTIKMKTGLNLSPYFTGAKFAWLLIHNAVVRTAQSRGDLCFGTIDSWLVSVLTNGDSFKTEPSNACRTQLMDLNTGTWDQSLCDLFGIDQNELPQIIDSDGIFGKTDLFGELNHSIPITSVLGDSQAALYAEGCHSPGQFKVTFGTGSSIMLNTGEEKIRSETGLNTSIAWRKRGQTTYVLEGNVNYSGAVITWLKNNLAIIGDPAETDCMAQAADPNDTTCLVPAFSGLAAPYNRPEMKAAFVGMTMLTGKNELVRASLDAVVFQIADIVQLLQDQSPDLEPIIHVDGGMICNHYLMQFLADIAQRQVIISPVQELSGVGAALNGFDSFPIKETHTERYSPEISTDLAEQRAGHWRKVITQLQTTEGV